MHLARRGVQKYAGCGVSVPPSPGSQRRAIISAAAAGQPAQERCCPSPRYPISDTCGMQGDGGRRQSCDGISCGSARLRWHLPAALALPRHSSSLGPSRSRTRPSSTAPWPFRARRRIPIRYRRNSRRRKNAADDALITIAYTFKTLSDEQRHAIYDALKGQPSASAANADVGTELPPSVGLRPVPDQLAAQVTQDRVLLVGTGRVVAGVF